MSHWHPLVAQTNSGLREAILNLTLENIFCVNVMLSKGLQNYTNPQHKFLHMGLTPPPPFTQCVKKTSDLVPGGFP